MRRLLAFQLMLSEKKGLPLSRLLSLKETDTRFSKRKELKRLQEESASPKLHRKRVKVKEKEDESDPRKEVPSSGSSLRSFATGANPPSSNLSHMVLAFLPLQLLLRHSSPHHGFPFISLGRYLPPTG